MAERTNRIRERQDMAIRASADALLSVCAVQTGTSPMAAYHRAHMALLAVLDEAAAEAKRGTDA